MQRKLYPALVKYSPLFLVSSVAFFLTLMMWSQDLMALMNGFMGFGLLCFGMLKAPDIQGFQKLFRKYDPFAKRIPAYGYAYPFIEIILAGLYLSGIGIHIAVTTTIICLSVNAVGVLQVMLKGETHICACVGSRFQLKVGKVTLAEDLLMIIMALLYFIKAPL